VVDRHWVSGCGTVDLVCVKGDTAVLVEVRSRTARSGHKVYIEDMKVGYRRRHSFRNQAVLYLAKHIDQNVARYDIISVQIADGYEASLYHCVGVCEVTC
jgi:Holliday junction resolvase-like predicted endonuclease